MLMSSRPISAPKPAATLAALAPDDAAAEDRDVRRRHARHAAQQDAASHLRAFEILGAFLDAHAPGDFAHRRQQRQIGRWSSRRVS